jgi:hypothetical protein
LYGHVHVDTKDHDSHENDSASGPGDLKSGHHSAAAAAAATATAPTSSRDEDSSKPRNAKKNTTKPALSHVKVLGRKPLENVKSTTTTGSSGVKNTTTTGSSGVKNTITTVEETEIETALVEVEIPTGRPHQIRIHMAYAGYPLVGDPLYLPGGIPNTLPRNFQFRKKEEEDMETEDEDEDNDNNDGDDTEDELKSARPAVVTSKNTTTTTTTTTKAYTKRVALPRDCGYHLHAHSITLENPCCGRSPASNDGDASTAVAAADPIIVPATTMTFTAPPPPLLREGPSGSSLVGNR